MAILKVVSPPKGAVFLLAKILATLFLTFCFSVFLPRRWQESLPESEKQKVPDMVLEQLESPDKVLVRPAVREMKVNDILQFFEHKKEQGDQVSLYVEYLSLSSYLPGLTNAVPAPTWGAALVGEEKNLWLGDGDTLGKLHFDPFENLLGLISGEKHLTLFSPEHSNALYEGHLREGILNYDERTGEFSRDELMESTSMVNSPIDLQNPELERYPAFSSAVPLDCKVREGDLLYMPAFWWHEVQVSAPPPASRLYLTLKIMPPPPSSLLLLHGSPCHQKKSTGIWPLMLGIHHFLRSRSPVGHVRWRSIANIGMFSKGVTLMVRLRSMWLQIRSGLPMANFNLATRYRL
jgi:hypothetical protein